MRPIPPQADAFVRDHEDCLLRVYDDFQPRVILKSTSTIYGTLTAGYGHTGPDVKVGMSVTQAMADRWLAADLQTAAERLYGQIGAIVDELTDNQYAALLSFVFNLGADPMWTIWKRLRARQFDQVPVEMMRFVYSKGSKLPGLVKRRADEVVLWSTDEPGTADLRLTSASLRELDTPPVAVEPTPAKRNPAIWAVIASPFLAAFNWLKDMALQVVGWLTPDQVHTLSGAISPYADKSALVANAVSGLAVLSAVLAAFFVVRKHNEARR